MRYGQYLRENRAPLVVSFDVVSCLARKGVGAWFVDAFDEIEFLTRIEDSENDALVSDLSPFWLPYITIFVT